METNNEKKSITLHQGIGNDAMEIKVQVTQEELDKMEQLRRFSPEKWEGKELDLLQFVRELIKTEADKVQQLNIEEKREKRKQRLRLIIGIIALLCVVTRIITYTLTKHYEKEAQQIREEHPELMNELLNIKETGHPHHPINTEEFLPKINRFFFDEISFQYPADWSFEDQTNGHRAREFYGSNKQESQIITYSWVTGPINITADNLIENTCNHYKTEFNYIRFFDIKKIKYHSYNAVSKDFEFTDDGETVFGQIICIVQKESACTIMKMAESEQDLASDDFKLMESTFHMPVLPVTTTE